MLKFISADFEKRKESTEPLWLIGVDGFATHTGTAKHNQALSQVREENTFNYINQHLFDNVRAVDAERFESRIVRDPKFHGFNKTTVEGENPLGRSVQVLMKRPNLPPSKQVPEQPPKKDLCPRSIHWEARITSSLSVGVGLVGGVLGLELRNLDCKRGQRFTYTGFGFTVGPIPIGIGGTSEFKKFSTGQIPHAQGDVACNSSSAQTK